MAFLLTVSIQYVVYIFSMAGLSGNLNLVASGVQYALFIVFTTIMFFYVDKVGRRPLLVFGALGMVFCHFVVGGLLSAGRIVPGGVDGNPNVPIELTGPKANTMIAFCYLLIIVYAMTLAPVCWIYAAEVWSLETRAVGMEMRPKATGSSIGLWGSTSLQALSTSTMDCSLSLESCAVWQRFSSTSPIRRLAAKPLRRSKNPLRLEVRSHGIPEWVTRG